MEKLKQLTLEDTDPIPADILIDIFSRVPAKSIGKFRCVSKFWASILGRLDFTELFLTNSLTRPRLLFTLISIYGKLAFFSSSPDQQDNSSSSSCLVATPHPVLSSIGNPHIIPPVRGLVCFEVDRFEENRLLVIHNPVTGNSITLPRLITMTHSKSFFGYDPIDKQFKVLLTNWSPELLNSHSKHYVLTLGSSVWRLIDECSKPLFRPSLVCGDGICINGVLYFIAEQDLESHEQDLESHKDLMILCFDIKYETFSFIKRPKDLMELGEESRLINNKGHLSFIQTSNNFFVDHNTRSFTLWVLKDTEWTKHFYEWDLSLSPWWHVVGDIRLHIIGMTGTCEIVLAPWSVLSSSSCHFYVFYYNLETNIVRKVRIRGFEALIEEEATPLGVDCFLDYVEDVSPI